MRVGKFERETKETKVFCEVNLDGEGVAKVCTGIGFFDHMLQAFAAHSGFDITVETKGDIEVDKHHTVEDTGIALGKAIKDALGDKKGIARFGNAYVPMDEALAFAALDVSGRSFLELFARFAYKNIGDYEADATEEFMRALAFNAEVTLHTRAMYGNNDHHITEAIFKAVARSFRAACKVEGDKIPSSKGCL
jgi:imidazoleglycerol-phosphate dehydratase